MSLASCLASCVVVVVSSWRRAWHFEVHTPLPPPLPTRPFKDLLTGSFKRYLTLHSLSKHRWADGSVADSRLWRRFTRKERGGTTMLDRSAWETSSPWDLPSALIFKPQKGKRLCTAFGLNRFIHRGGSTGRINQTRQVQDFCFRTQKTFDALTYKWLYLLRREARRGMDSTYIIMHLCLKTLYALQSERRSIREIMKYGIK